MEVTFRISLIDNVIMFLGSRKENKKIPKPAFIEINLPLTPL
jgi:hypothetical protein